MSNARSTSGSIWPSITQIAATPRIDVSGRLSADAFAATDIGMTQPCNDCSWRVAAKRSPKSRSRRLLKQSYRANLGPRRGNLVAGGGETFFRVWRAFAGMDQKRTQ